MEDLNKEKMDYIISVLERYYNKESIDYLKSLVNLEISVINCTEANVSFNEEFKKVDSFLKIAMYNIIYRALDRIKSIETVSFNKNCLYPKLSLGELIISYGNNDSDAFSLLRTNFKNDGNQLEIPVLTVQQIDTIKPGSKTQSLRTLSTLRRDLTNEATKVLLDDWKIEFTDSDKRLFSKDYQKKLGWIEISKKIL